MQLDSENKTNQKTPLSLLKEIWGYNAFRPNQEEIIASILQKKDTVAILPTGAGKSVCYQIPALILDGLTLVISPLVALMKDQVNWLKENNVKAAMLSAEMNRYEIIEVFDNIKFGNIKLLYVSPERLQNDLFKEKIAELNVDLIAVDEAHCISNWGHDFRPSYLQIATIRELFPTVPVLALTATATDKVLKEIIKNLALSTPKVFIASFEQKNLTYHIQESFDKKNDLAYELHKNKGSSIVFIRNRKETEEISEYLNRLGFKATFYHSKLSIEEKNKRQEAWFKDQHQIMVATNAFGMGIDKANVRNIFHLSIPESVESYYQEVGRAGRDGLESRAVLFYNLADINLDLNLFKKKLPTKTEFNYILSMLFNEYSIGKNEFTEEIFNYNPSLFIKKHKISKQKLASVTNFLHQSGIIFINTYQKNNFVKLLVKPRELQRLNKDIPIRLIEYIERNPKSENEFISIDEYLIAKELELRLYKVKDSLGVLYKQGIIDYKIKSSNTIQFLLPRNDVFIIENKTIWKLFEEIQQSQYQRLLDIHYFVQKKNLCRKQLILGYFNEFPQTKCVKCDVCAKKNTIGTTKNIDTKILSFLSITPISLNEILYECKDFSKELVIQTLEELIESKKIKKSSLNFFHL